MAIYHCQVKPVSRGKGQSSTAGAAYRSCSKIFDERTAELHDYTRKRGLEHAEIVLSKQAVRQDIQWARDRARLWNEAEAAERRRDGRPAREYEVALPHELTKEQRVALSRAFAEELANRFQCAVDIAIHKPHRHGDQRNFHAHLYATTRQVMPAGLGEKTWIERSDTDRAKAGLPPGKEEITAIRERWAEAANQALAAANRKERVDHRSLEAQGIDRAPTRHQGPAIRGVLARGERSIVVERIEVEVATARLAKAAEVGRILGVARRLRQSIIDLSGNVRGASGARPAVERPRDVDEIRRQAREQWRERRERERSTGPSRSKERDVGLDKDHRREKGKGRDGPDDDFSR